MTNSSNRKIRVFASKDYCSSTSIFYRLKEKSWSASGDDFEVTDGNGNHAFSVKGKYFSFHNRKYMYDHQSGDCVFSTSDKTFTMHKTMRIYNAEDKEIYRIKKRFALFKSKMTAEITNLEDGHKMTVTVKGDWRTKNADMMAGHRLICSVRRKSTLAGWFLEKDDYSLEVLPGVDAAFCLSMCIALDEFNRDQDQGRR